MKKARIHPASTYTDKYLWDLIRADSVDAFNEVYNRYWDLVFRITLKRLHVKEIVEEIVQDAFIVLWEKRHELQVDSLKNYLLAITRYAVFHYISRQQTIAARMGEMRQEEQTTNNNIEDIVNSRLLLQLVDSMAEELPEKSKQVFRHNKLQGYTVMQTAEAFNISPKTAEGHLTKALKTLRLKLGTLYLWVL
ncbi:sigma-70 family RNA polymerase sigma factor [Chitinophaga tropicalis]|uniref:sigma-70 family RNA polymerase sigma factor n=1 Tax=Chitinophaga tropicalis TaxID=2683588 RepID=UPI0012F841A2|nr:sigma-70 family RNA polymerase sigma factor [Chitinophaga tropicalis]